MANHENTMGDNAEQCKAMPLLEIHFAQTWITALYGKNLTPMTLASLSAAAPDCAALTGVTLVINQSSRGVGPFHASDSWEGTMTIPRGDSSELCEHFSEAPSGSRLDTAELPQPKKCPSFIRKQHEARKGKSPRHGRTSDAMASLLPVAAIPSTFCTCGFPL